MKRFALLLSLTLAFVVPAFAAAQKGAAPAVIAHGEKVNLADHLVAGKLTVVDFTSEYCPPCRAYEEPLKKLHATRGDVAVVKVDINRPGVQRIDWKSPVAQQFELKSIPQFHVYGPDGQLMAEGRKARALVDGWIKQLK
jgi:thioredoxin-like negative regulator of GroEL